MCVCPTHTHTHTHTISKPFLRNEIAWSCVPSWAGVMGRFYIKFISPALFKMHVCIRIYILEGIKEMGSKKKKGEK